MAKKTPPHRVEIDERYIAEWVGFGLIEMGVLLAHHAQFDEWCHEHHREEQDDNDTSPPEGRGGGGGRRGSDGRFIRG